MIPGPMTARNDQRRGAWGSAVDDACGMGWSQGALGGFLDSTN
jgi:hypothetical protein